MFYNLILYSHVDKTSEDEVVATEGIEDEVIEPQGIDDKVVTTVSNREKRFSVARKAIEDGVVSTEGNRG